MSMGWSMDQVHKGGSWTTSTGVVHEPGPQGWSMNQVHKGGPWTWVRVLNSSLPFCHSTILLNRATALYTGTGMCSKNSI